MARFEGQTVNIGEAPPLSRGDMEYLDAFFRLGTARVISIGGMGGMITGHIPCNVIWQFMEREQIPDDQKIFYEEVILTIDSNYVAYENRKAAEQSDSGSGVLGASKMNRGQAHA